jgi:glycosyltransferase involved in cell wall biosynthesis
MGTTPLISVVIPTYNRACDLERALRSVQAQTFTKWEVLIVDNHSVDNTDEVVSGFNDSRMKLFKIHNNGVIAVSRNMGIREASGEYIAFLDSDDWWKPKKLSLSLDPLNAGADIVYHDLFLVIKSDQRIFWKTTHCRNLKRPFFDDLLANANTLPNSSVVVRKKCLAEIGGIAEGPDLIGCEDYDAWLRIAQRTKNFKYIPSTLGYYWVGGGNVSNPQRTLNNIEVIEARFAEEINKLYQNNNVWWLNYVRGRAHYILGSFGISKLYLKAIVFGKSPVLIYLKSRWMLLRIKAAPIGK